MTNGSNDMIPNSFGNVNSNFLKRVKRERRKKENNYKTSAEGSDTRQKKKFKHQDWPICVPHHFHLRKCG